MPKKRHQIGDMTHFEYTGIDLPRNVNPIFATTPSALIYAIIQLDGKGTDVLGLCYRAHPEAPLTTRIRVKDGKLTVYDLDCKTPDEAQKGFQEMREQFPNWMGHVLTPNKNRGRYVAYCKMLHCNPMDRKERNERMRDSDLPVASRRLDAGLPGDRGGGVRYSRKPLSGYSLISDPQ